MGRKPDLTQRGVERLSERERNVGVDPDDDAARWLDEHAPKPPPPVPKRAFKNKTLHQWRKRTES